MASKLAFHQSRSKLDFAGVGHTPPKEGSAYDQKRDNQTQTFCSHEQVLLPISTRRASYVGVRTGGYGLVCAGRRGISGKVGEDHRALPSWWFQRHTRPLVWE